MANGDAAALAGFAPVAPGADIRQGYDDINRLADFTVDRLGASGIVQQFTLLNGFHSFGPNEHELLNDVVWFTFTAAQTGNAAYSAGVQLGTMPSDRRPRRLIYFSGLFNGVAKEMQITTDGRVLLPIAAPAGQGGIAVSGSFRVA